MKKIAINLFFYAFVSLAFAQTTLKDNALDSVRRQLKQPGLADTLRIDLLNTLAFNLYGKSLDSVRIMADSVSNYARRIGYDRGLAASYWIKGMYLEDIGDYGGAIDTYLQALRIFERLQDKSGIARVNNLMGLAHLPLKRFDEAYAYFSNALATYQAMGNRERVATCLNNMGLVYVEKGNYERAIDLINKGLVINDSLGLRNKVAVSLNDLGEAYYRKGDYLQALTFFKKSLNINQAIDRVSKLPENYNNTAAAYRQLGQYDEAISYYKTGLEKALALNFKEQIIAAYQGLSACYAEQNKFKEAYEYHRLFHRFSDSLFNAESADKIARLQTLYQTEQQANKIALLTKEKQLQEEEVELHRWQLAGVSSVLLLFMALAFVFYRNWKQRQKANQLLMIKNEEINQKHEEIRIQADRIALALSELEVRNRNITSSLNYAQRIQSAILPTEARIKKSLPQFFVIYRPRDIVSGDFYWFQDIGELENGSSGERMIIAAADCTGHGVPGAFMSLIGNDLLNQIVNLRNVYQPGRILNLLDKGVRKALQKEGSDNRDGMELGICYIDLPASQLYFSGAMNPLYCVQDDAFHVIKGTKHSIGSTLEGVDFQEHSIRLDQPVTFYLCSDGFQDQFGGPANRKFMVTQLREVLHKASQMPFHQQQQYLETTLDNWMGHQPQIDDILLIGVRID
ncbi:tetratricopeptide repeat protein [Rhodoflexus caldus]|uniref:tetratricopeptide repeat protein n=1 Tax=Rhodoflexus caldus TaxID=2891236 RepID=UPI00202A6480|nr:tetratricopeptide repeat protein [Rhodoflexus caldus]